MSCIAIKLLLIWTQKQQSIFARKNSKLNYNKFTQKFKVSLSKIYFCSTFVFVQNKIITNFIK